MAKPITIKLLDEKQYNHAVETIQKLPKEKYCVIIKEIEEQRTQDQNRLIWLLASHFSDNSEHFNRTLSKTAWYYAFSAMFLDPILTVDFRTGQVLEVAKGMSNLSKKEFTWVINKIYEFAHLNDFPVPSPEDLRRNERDV